MKKTLLLLALAATLTSNAQLEVRSNGQVWAGNPKVGSSTVSTDTGASINVFGLESAHGGRLSFGDFGKVYIVTGCSVYSGGSMNMNAKTIVLSSGFSVAKGGSLKITK